MAFTLSAAPCPQRLSLWLHSNHVHTRVIKLLGYVAERCALQCGGAAVRAAEKQQCPRYWTLWSSRSNLALVTGQKGGKMAAFHNPSSSD